ANSKQVPNNAKLQKDFIIIESSDDELDIIGPHKRQRLNKYLNVVNNAYENTLANLEDESSGKNKNQVTNNENLKKEVIIIDRSDDEVDLVGRDKSYRFKKEFIFVKKNDVSIMPCDKESIFPNIYNQSSGKNPKEVIMNQNLEKNVIMNDISDYKVDIVYDESRTTNENLNTEETNTDFDDEESAIFKRSTKVPHASLQGKRKFTYIEDSDEEEGDGDASEYKQHEFVCFVHLI
nr:hypothetical protein [Tanacetum cinerariifolium]GEZ13780.1 hypothetical protein [Tanacetum cinerariifolium]